MSHGSPGWGERVREARAAAGLTQAALARATGLSIGAIRDLEQGRTRTPSPGSRHAVEQALGLGPNVRRRRSRAQIAVLGPLHCSIGADDVTPRGELQARLLAVAAVYAGDLVSDAELADLLWPTHPPRDVPAALQAHAARLRRELHLSGRHDGDDAPARDVALVRERRGYRLLGSDAVDTEAFARLTNRAREESSSTVRASILLDALGLWRGAVLADMPDLMSHPRVASWQTARRNAAAELAGSAMECLAEFGDRAAAAVGAVVDVHLLDETLAARLARLQTALGRPGDAVATCTRVRAAVADALGLDLGTELRAAYAEALGSDVSTARVATRRPTPAELPRDIADFVGREDEAAAMASELVRADGLPGLVALVGMGGVGKSTLAVRVAHQVKDHFPDGQLYLDLRGAQSRPVPATHAVDLLLRRLGVVVEAAEDDPEHRVALLRSALSGGRHLLVLDNAADADQIRDLVPGSPGSAAIITSRRSLAGLDGVVSVRLSGLDPAAAQAFLRGHRAAPAQRHRDDDAIAGIAAACGNLPLALRLAMDHAAAAAADLTQLHDSLVDSNTRWKVLRHGDRAVWACLETGWSGLGPELRRTFGDLAALPGVDLPIPAALAALDQEDDDQLVALRESSLADLREGRRVGMHDLLRDFGRRLAGRDVLEPQGPAARLIAWYSMRARAALAQVPVFTYRPFPEPPLWVSALRGDDIATVPAGWLDSEYPTLFALVDAMTNGQAPFDWTLAFCVALAGQERGESARSAELVEGALQAVDPGDQLAIAFLALAAGRGQVYSTSLDDGLQSLHRARAAARALSYPPLEVWALEGICAVHDMRGQMELVETQYGVALEIVRRAPLPELESTLLNNVGDVAVNRGNLDVAADHFRRAIALNVAAGHERGRLVNIANLGLAVWWAGEDEKAIDILDPVTEPLLEVGNARAACEAFFMQARSAVTLGRRAHAETVAQRAMQLVRRLEDDTLAARALASAAMVQAQWHDLDRGLGQLQEALDLARRVGAPLPEIEALLAHGAPSLVALRPAIAAAAGREAQRLAVATGNRAAQAKAASLIAAVDARTSPVPGP